MRPGDSLRFDPTTPEIATAALRQLRAEATETKAQSVDTSGWDWVWDEESGDGDDDPNKVLSVLDPAPVGDLGGTWRLLASDRLSSDVGRVSAFSLKVMKPVE